MESHFEFGKCEGRSFPLTGILAEHLLSDVLLPSALHQREQTILHRVA